MSGSTGFLDRENFISDEAMIAGEKASSGYNHVDFLGPVADGSLRLVDSLLEVILAAGKRGGNGSGFHATSF